MLKDKDMAGSLAELDGLIDEWFLASLHGPRAATADQLATALGSGRGAALTFASVGMPTAPPWPHRVPDDMVIVFGSFYTVADVLALGSV